MNVRRCCPTDGSQLVIAPCDRSVLCGLINLATAVNGALIAMHCKAVGLGNGSAGCEPESDCDGSDKQINKVFLLGHTHQGMPIQQPECTANA